VFECVAILDIMHQCKDLDEASYLDNLSLADELSRMLYKMITNLSNLKGS
jgi:hypothetical protein